MLQPSEERKTPTIRVITQNTPNPDALKFITAKDFKTKGKATFSHPAMCLHVPLASKILEIGHVVSVHFFENVLTVNQDGQGDWTVLEEEIIKTIQNLLPSHNPDFDSEQEVDTSNWNEDRKKIEEIIDRTIRPGLQADGGDIEIIDFEQNLLTIRYEGACGSCPSSRSGTLQGIESILRQEFDPNIQIAAL